MHTAALVAQAEGHVCLLVFRTLEAQFAELRSILVVFLVVVDEESYGERAGGGTGGNDLPGRRHKLLRSTAANAVDGKRGLLLCDSFASKRGIFVQKEMDGAAPVDGGAQLRVSRTSTRNSRGARQMIPIKLRVLASVLPDASFVPCRQREFARRDS